MKLKHALVFIIVTFLFSCKKEKITTAEKVKLAEVPNFNPNKGFKYLTSYAENNGGGISFMSSIDISYTTDNQLHWLFSRNNPYGKGAILYRKNLDAATGEPIGDGDLTSVGGSIKYNGYDRGLEDKFGFVPYTNKIYRAYRSGDAKFGVEGDVKAAEYGGYDGTAIKATFYANEIPTLHYAGNIKTNMQDITTAIGAYEVRENKAVAIAGVSMTFWSYGKAHNFHRLFHGGMSFPTDKSGGSSAFGFTESKAYLFKKVGRETVPVDSVAISGVPPFYVGSVVPEIPYLAKTSEDLKTTVLFCYEVDNHTAFSGKFLYSTFIINNTTNKITLGVKQFAMLPNLMDFDLKGNIFYTATGSSGTAKIMKVSGVSEEIYAEGFFNAQMDVRSIQVVSEKIYITSINFTDKMVSKIALFVSN
ncbi:hypothetical protein EZJ43_14740 [Pedobacter changchengzhani]|uniref:DUF4374 domain-containing protein n=1 Tax=Pedobacter changchengzhani TaxID=2529274 RepID=A0A4R5MHV9_9SPHI|nr:hypothetical protein [Pedobacter changchengzhani]TDG35157.1 hypothetical protein EZJ43_14740 [Pedobacter changchengzhani]